MAKISYRPNFMSSSGSTSSTSSAASDGVPPPLPPGSSPQPSAGSGGSTNSTNTSSTRAESSSTSQQSNSSGGSGSSGSSGSSQSASSRSSSSSSASPYPYSADTVSMTPGNPGQASAMMQIYDQYGRPFKVEGLTVSENVTNGKWSWIFDGGAPLVQRLGNISGAIDNKTDASGKFEDDYSVTADSPEQDLIKTAQTNATTSANLTWTEIQTYSVYWNGKSWNLKNTFDRTMIFDVDKVNGKWQAVTVSADSVTKSSP